MAVSFDPNKHPAYYGTPDAKHVGDDTDADLDLRDQFQHDSVDVETQAEDVMAAREELSLEAALEQGVPFPVVYPLAHIISDDQPEIHFQLEFALTQNTLLQALRQSAASGPPTSTPLEIHVPGEALMKQLDRMKLLPVHLRDTSSKQQGVWFDFLPLQIRGRSAQSENFPFDLDASLVTTERVISDTHDSAQRSKGVAKGHVLWSTVGGWRTDAHWPAIHWTVPRHQATTEPRILFEANLEHVKSAVFRTFATLATDVVLNQLYQDSVQTKKLFPRVRELRVENVSKPQATTGMGYLTLSAHSALVPSSDAMCKVDGERHYKYDEARDHLTLRTLDQNVEQVLKMVKRAVDAPRHAMVLSSGVTLQLCVLHEQSFASVIDYCSQQRVSQPPFIRLCVEITGRFLPPPLTR
jgi:hypothetical protein